MKEIAKIRKRKRKNQDVNVVGNVKGPGILPQLEGGKVDEEWTRLHIWKKKK